MVLKSAPMNMLQEWMLMTFTKDRFLQQNFLIENSAIDIVDQISLIQPNDNKKTGIRMPQNHNEILNMQNLEIL